MKKISFVLILSLAMLISACSNHLEESSSQIYDVEWKLTKINGKLVHDLKVEEFPTLMFSKEKNRVSGFAGCNRFFGTASVIGEQVSFSPLGSTQMACPSLALENEYLKALQNCDSYKATNNSIVLFSDGKAALEFDK